MINRITLKQKIREEIIYRNINGWKYGDVRKLAKKYGYSEANLYKLKRIIKKESKISA